jgi:hypothetical protein
LEKNNDAPIFPSSALNGSFNLIAKRKKKEKQSSEEEKKT